MPEPADDCGEQNTLRLPVEEHTVCEAAFEISLPGLEVQRKPGGHATASPWRHTALAGQLVCVDAVLPEATYPTDTSVGFTFCEEGQYLERKREVQIHTRVARCQGTVTIP